MLIHRPGYTMRGIVIIITLFSASCLSIYAADSISVRHRIQANQSSAEKDFFSLVYVNPAMKFRQHAYTLNELRAGGEYRHEQQPFVIQEGDGRQMGVVDVNSFIRKGQSSLWGEARYMNGKKMGRNWNETSDYALLYPYVMGDTIGGDLKSEQYYFAGGYARQTGRFTFGAKASYCANIEYRNADPRPKNLTGDLNVTIGGAMKLGTAYTAGISLHARKYKQTNELAFYNELGVPNIYHLTGLGTDYYRFRGSRGNTFYKGKAFGGSVNLLPFETGVTGFTASASYDYFTFGKIISSLNELPMADVGEHTVKAEIGWRSLSVINQWGVKGEVSFVSRAGTENLFGDATNNTYPLIASEKMYYNDVTQVGVSGFYEHIGAGDMRYSILPAVKYRGIRTRYVYSERHMDINHLIGEILLRASRPCGKFLLQGEIGALYTASVSPSLQLSGSGIKESEKLYEPVYSNYRYLSEDNALLRMAVRGDYSPRAGYSLFIAVHYEHGWQSGKRASDYVAASVGVAF